MKVQCILELGLSDLVVTIHVAVQESFIFIYHSIRTAKFIREIDPGKYEKNGSIPGEFRQEKNNFLEFN
jgi:hypothetical protein